MHDATKPRFRRSKARSGPISSSIPSGPRGCRSGRPQNRPWRAAIGARARRGPAPQNGGPSRAEWGADSSE
eukprot:6287675-Alexandrium_andersonii.AAC.1